MGRTIDAVSRRDFLRTSAAGLTGLALAGCAPTGAPRGGRRTNVVFILIDDLGWADLGCYGNTYFESPHIDRVAGQGMRFTDAYAAGAICTPSRAAIQTGKYPARLNQTALPENPGFIHTPLTPPEYVRNLSVDETLVGEAFKAAGYTTALIGKWHLSTVNQDPAERRRYLPHNQGYDVSMPIMWEGQMFDYFSPHGIGTIPDGPEGEYLTDRLTDEADRFVREHAREPFFLFLSHEGVHAPFQAKEEDIAYFRKKPSEFRDANTGEKPAAYAAMIRSVDEGVGKLMATLDELGLAEDTVVVIASDNGGSHRATDNAPLRGFKGTGYEGGLRVPLIVRWPGRVRPGAVSGAVTINTDFYPTLLEAVGLPLRPGQHKDGVSLVPVLAGEREDLEREAIYWHFPHYHRTTPYSAVRAGRWKLIEYLERGSLELYDLERDIGETVNLAGARPEVTERLRGMLHAWRERVDAPMPKPNPNADPTQETHRSRGNPWTTEWERYGR